MSQENELCAVNADDAALVMKLRRWLFDARSAETANGRPAEIAMIDQEAGVPEGTTARLLEQAVAVDKEVWEVLEHDDSHVRLLYVPERGRAS